MKKQYIYAGISIFLWSTTATVTKLLLGSINSMQILLFSSFFASIYLLIVNIVKGSLKQLKTYKIKDYIKISGIGFLGIFLYKLFLFLGINKMQASQAFILNYLWPIMTVVFACIILKEHITVKKMLAIILSFIGVIIVTSNGNINIPKENIIGALYCISAAISYGLFCVVNKKMNYNKYVSMMLFYIVSFSISLIYILVTKEWFVPKANQLMGLLWIGIFTSAIAFTSWVLALEKEDTAKISNLAYITPFLSLIWTVLILKEKISIYAIIGLVVIILGVLIQLNNKSKKN